MVKAVSRGQALQVSARVATQVNWDKLDGDLLQQQVISLSAEEFGRRFTAFLQAGARVNLGPNILRIIPQPFNPAAFMGQGWTIWRGPANGDGLNGQEEQDDRSLALTEIDLTKIQLTTMLRRNDTSIMGEEKLKRLKKAKHIRLDARIFQTLWENQGRIPEEWKGRYVYFDGTVLRNPDGNRYVLCLFFDGGGCNWGYIWLGCGWGSGSPSAVLVQPTP